LVNYTTEELSPIGLNHKQKKLLDSLTMKYRETLTNSSERWKFAEGLKEHLAAPELEDVRVKFEVPYIADLRGKPIPKTSHPLDPKKIRLPARLNNALIPYPQKLKEIITLRKTIEGDDFHGHHKGQLNTLFKAKTLLETRFQLKIKPIKFDVPSLKKLVKCQYSTRTELINLSALEFAKKATCHELSIAAMEEIRYQPNQKIKSPYLSFLVAMQRMRVLLCTHQQESLPENYAEEIDAADGDVTIFKDGTYTQICMNKSYSHFLIVSGSHFMMYHSTVDYWFSGNFSYLDYALTLADTINNLEILSYDKSYGWAREFFLLLINLAESESDHNQIVNFMKSFEGFILNLSDYDESFAMNWVPLMDGAYDLWELDQKFSGKKYAFQYIPALLHDPLITIPKESYLCRFIVVLKKMTRSQLQEISALHKFVFYSEVDAEAGVKKFLKRVHTPRAVDRSAIKNITRLAKQEFTISYAKKHKCLPTMRGPTQKITLLQIHFNKHQLDKVKDFALSWWDDLQPWACMDSTLTDDALEFAKDKGALKSKFTCGPGDSRKELLQAIELPDYELKDLLANGQFDRQAPEVYRTRQSSEPINHKHPARLIEKEREQKEEARLFANGELSNKHALSVITTKMKKALSYFDEQLMTPSDSQRKILLHRAAQTLLQNDHFSILLDIEGHNQSMQSENTSELLEFMGNIFGETGWGSLANYFGALFVYHYDEYLDNVIVSKGQHGGIEGWMNPAWTLHTLLMMKLLRYMTDIDLPQIMVYSDDVNAITKIRQATEMSMQAMFSKIMKHCEKFGMIAKFSQTTLSKHRATMLRQHYSEGHRADSTLKRLMAVSGANNAMLMSEELEVAGICSSAASALEFSSHSETCCYLKNYKLGILLARLPQMILCKPQEQGSLASLSLPTGLAEMLYHVKDDSSLLSSGNSDHTVQSIINDVTCYLHRNKKIISESSIQMGIDDFFSYPLARERYVDSPDRVLYMQIYDDFVKDLLFFWIYTPCALGGLGGILHIDMILSGHSNGFSKAVHYLHQWVVHYSSDSKYFLTYMSNILTNSTPPRTEDDEWQILTSKWPSEFTITAANTSVTSSIKSMVENKTKNKNVKALLEQAKNAMPIAKEMVAIFRTNFHSRIAQFYYENSSVHFLDLLTNKIETSSGLLSNISRLDRLRLSLVRRTIHNLRIASAPRNEKYGQILPNTDIIDYLMRRRARDFPTISFIQAEEILYDNKLRQTDDRMAMVTVRKCSPTYFKDGLQVYNDPRIGDEVLYKGEFLDKERMVGNKEELLAAKVVSVTKWLLTKTNNLGSSVDVMSKYDCVKACNITLMTLTGHKFADLMPFCPDETGGEILHRIPNMRFSSKTYIRSEMSRALEFVAELSQTFINNNNLLDSNINFDYIRMRLMCAMIVRSKFPNSSSIISRYELTNFVGICDVQFVSPQMLEYESELTVKPYAEFRGHKFSDLRFRFLASSYLSIENLDDLALFPQTEDSDSMSRFGYSIKKELVYKYARSLDKEYMTASTIYPRKELWSPIYQKLASLDKDFAKLTDDEKFKESISYLEAELLDRNEVKLLRANDKAEHLLQVDCYQTVLEDRPDDQVFQNLIDTYMVSQRRDVSHIPVPVRLEKYNMVLASHDSYRSTLCKLLLSELIITLHFHSQLENGVLTFAVIPSLKQLESSGVATTYLQSINPELYAQTQILGLQYLTQYLRTERGELVEYLYEISGKTAITDASVPDISLSVAPMTTLGKDIRIPDAAESVVYIHEEIGDKAMESIGDIIPICHYADKCCAYGADPSVNESPTGSDTFCSQYGFFKLLMSAYGIDEETDICDLTAGRGDGKYAGESLGLKLTSYSRPDNFTGTMYHPSIVHDKTYDVTQSNTLEFIKDFDFVHIDISFLRGGKSELGDLLLFLESSVLPYAIRLNSITLNTYSTCMKQLEVRYKHHIAYSVSSRWRTPQIYLIGTPGIPMEGKGDVPLKKTLAFRSMALSYSALLTDPFAHQLLHVPQMNSISVCLPSEDNICEFLAFVSDKSIADERRYYTSRFLNEFSADSTIHISPDHLPPRVIDEIGNLIEALESHTDPAYKHLGESDIGRVKPDAKPYLLSHLRHLQQNHSPKKKFNASRANLKIISLLRIYHPMRVIRSLCNVIIGLSKVCPEVDEYNMDTIQASIRNDRPYAHLKDSPHQKEIITAIKLLVLSVYYDEPILGLIYCALIAQNHPSKAGSMRKVRFRYKALSGYRDLIRKQMQSGALNATSILVMADDLFSKRPQQLKQAAKYSTGPVKDLDDGKVGESIDFGLDKIFDQLEAFALSKNDDMLTWPTGEDGVMDVLEDEIGTFNEMSDGVGFQMNFNLDVMGAVEQAVDRLGLVLNPVTGIYEGFDEGDDYDEDEDLW